MAGFSIYDDDFVKQLDSLASGFDDIAREGLEKAAPYLVQTMKKEARQAVRHEGESEMVNSILAKKPKKTKNGDWVLNVVPTGYTTHTYTRGRKGKRVRKYRLSNAAKMVWLEYGNRGGRQAARPFIAKATKDAETDVLNAIQGALNERIDK